MKGQRHKAGVQCQEHSGKGLQQVANTQSLTRNIIVKIRKTMSSVWLFTVIRTDTTLDLSQKAEKVCLQTLPGGLHTSIRLAGFDSGTIIVRLIRQLVISAFALLFVCYLMGVAQAPTPSTKNYAVEKPLWTFVEHYSTKVHRVCSVLGQQPAWSLSEPLPGKYALITSKRDVYKKSACGKRRWELFVSERFFLKTFTCT